MVGIPEALIFGAICVGYGWMWGHGLNPQKIAQRNRDAKVGAWLRGRIDGALDRLRFTGPEVSITNRTIWTCDGKDAEITVRVGAGIEPLRDVVAETVL